MLTNAELIELEISLVRKNSQRRQDYGLAAFYDDPYFFKDVFVDDPERFLCEDNMEVLAEIAVIVLLSDKEAGKKIDTVRKRMLNKCQLASLGELMYRVYRDRISDIIAGAIYE